MVVQTALERGHFALKWTFKMASVDTTLQIESKGNVEPWAAKGECVISVG